MKEAIHEGYEGHEGTRRNTKKKKKECPRNSRKTRKNPFFSVFSVSSVDTLSFSSSCSFVSFVDRFFVDGLIQRKEFVDKETRNGWEFWVDRGGTFTDIVARTPHGALVSHKLLSENPERYPDAVTHGIRHLLRSYPGGYGQDEGAASSHEGARIDAIKMGTTVATNALLERKGERAALVITEGFGDALRIGYQERPALFAHEIVLPSLLYERVIEVRERIDAAGNVLIPLEADTVRSGLRAAFDAGIRAVAIVFMHGYRYPEHERRVAHMARGIGYPQVSVSHEASPLVKLVSRGDTTVVDAYLSPVLGRYVAGMAAEVDGMGAGGTRILFMQSNGGLTGARRFRGKDSILSGPAGGVVGAVATAEQAGFGRIIGFDMGGTSTDVSHYAGSLERAFDTKIAGARMRVPVLRIHTIAAGGGSLLRFRDGRYQVGPGSAGANPGPACYRRGGPLTVTDCNVMVGKIDPRFFPAVFGPTGELPIDKGVVRKRFAALAREIEKATGQNRSPEAIADGFLRIAVTNMANAIKKISIERGYDITDDTSSYALCAFGAAGGQHACLVAGALGMGRILIHAHAGVLSAYGMGLAKVRALGEASLDAPLTENLTPRLVAIFDTLAGRARGELEDQGIDPAKIGIRRTVHLKYAGTDASLPVAFADSADMIAQFEKAHGSAYGFLMPGREHRVEMVSLEAIGHGASPPAAEEARDGAAGGNEAPAPSRDIPPPIAEAELYTHGKTFPAPVHERAALPSGARVPGPAIIVEANATTVIEPGWRAVVTKENNLLLTRVGADGVRTDAVRTDAVRIDAVRLAAHRHPTRRYFAPEGKPDPVMLEVFNNLFMSIAEQMGAALVNTAYSVNIKERLDFSCALFDAHGYLVANAPHIPVHLGSMGESVRAVLKARGDTLGPGDVLALNDPYNGGSHLPDITVITPVFDSAGTHIVFFVASRGHHADIGGITPGSMPPRSRHIREEGVLIDNFLLVDRGRFRETELRELLASGPWPARNPDRNIADLKAQIAANEKGVGEIQRMVNHYGQEMVSAYMGHVQDNAEAAVSRVIADLSDGSFEYAFDDGARIAVAITINDQGMDKTARRALIDFTGTSAQQPTNFNAPLAVCRAAVLYVFRTLVEDPIPLNEGCLRPLEIRVPAGCLLHPAYPAAVAAGNVEVAQCVTDSLFGALGIMAASQGTMNNFTFGNQQYQYYETLCGGTGAGPGFHGNGFHGTSAVHAHMTNSRLTDPEILEQRFPVLLERFAIRRGSGGQGRFRGGDGVVRRMRFLEPMSAAILSNHRNVAPFGITGGGPGKTGRNSVERADGSREALASTDETVMNTGDVFVIETPGGGGSG
ncbi:MAG: 5-oxoprolinase (ATP-hydrolysing) [Candidatus Kentron sp. G]|nr:MAG: 5-oxoprolinase (ATP-hydrolysing) [Candidatus Kentron sp. G]